MINGEEERARWRLRLNALLCFLGLDFPED
jgi:hypothetical protein